MNATQPTPIAVAVVRRAGEVLIGRRPAGVPLAGLWEFPGGKVAPGEAPAEAAARECVEESGLSVEVGDLCLEVLHSYPHGKVRIQFFAAVPIDPGQQPCRPFRWVRVSELSEYPFPPANAPMIADLMGQK